jgi:hypothetical protein
MAVLKSLTFTSLPQPGANPTLDRRSRVVERLEEQKRLVSDPNYKRTHQTWIKGEDGKKTSSEIQQRVLPWWRVTPNGSYAFFIKSGSKPVEFEKGKAAIAVPSLDKLPSIIDTLINAVRSGELDDQLAHASKQASARRAKKAA